MRMSCMTAGAVERAGAATRDVNSMSARLTAHDAADPSHIRRKAALDRRPVQVIVGADARNRTEDPIITSDVLCQLSYVGPEEAMGF